MLKHGRRCGWWGGGMGDCGDCGGGGGARRGAKRQVGVVVLVRHVKPHVYLEYSTKTALHIASATDEDMGGDYRDFRLARRGASRRYTVYCTYM